MRAEALEAPARSLHLFQAPRWAPGAAGTFDAEAGQVVATALRQATSPDPEAEPSRTSAQRRAEALVDVCGSS